MTVLLISIKTKMSINCFFNKKVFLTLKLEHSYLKNLIVFDFQAWGVATGKNIFKIWQTNIQ